MDLAFIRQNSMKTCFLIPIQGNGLHHLFMRMLFLRGWENYVRDVNKIYKYRKWRGGVVVNHLHKDSCQETVEWSLEARSRKRNPRGRRHTAPQLWSPWKIFQIRRGKRNRDQDDWFKDQDHQGSGWHWLWGRLTYVDGTSPRIITFSSDCREI